MSIGVSIVSIMSLVSITSIVSLVSIGQEYTSILTRR
jgi:hypothetical protein